MKTIVNEDFLMSFRVDTDDVSLLAELACGELELDDGDEEQEQEQAEVERKYRIPAPVVDFKGECEKIRMQMRSQFRMGRLTDGLSTLYDLEHFSGLFDKNYNPQEDIRGAVQACIDGRELFGCGDFDFLMAKGIDPLTGNLSGVDEGWVECWTAIRGRVSTHD